MVPMTLRSLPHSGCHAYTTRRHLVLWVLIPSVVQSPAPAPSAGLSHAGGSVPAPVNQGNGRHHDGGLCPPSPQDLTLFSSRVDGLCCAVIGDRRTMVGLDRRIGQRRDATRAPNQARSGWRPSGRLPDSPLHHLRTAEILSKQPGPPQRARRARLSSGR
jgi:hypothetical protein